MAGVDYTIGEEGPNEAPPGNGSGRVSQQGGGGVNPLLGILMTLGMMGLGSWFRNRSEENAVPPELRQMLTMANQRMAFQNPEFEAITRGTHEMLPGFARTGTPLSGSLTNQIPEAPKSSSGGGGENPFGSLNPLRNPLLAGLLGALAGGGLPGGASANLGDLARGLANLFRGDRNPFGGRTTVTGINNHNLPSYDPFGYGFDGLPGFNGSPNDPSGGTGRGPGMAGYYEDPYNPFDDPYFFNNPDNFGGLPSDPSGGSGVGPGMAGFRGGPAMSGGGSDMRGPEWWSDE